MTEDLFAMEQTEEFLDEGNLSNQSNPINLSNLSKLSQSNLHVLDKEDLEYKNLNQGEFRGFWYFGKRINDRDFIILYDGNKPQLLGDKTVIVQGNRKGINEIEKFGLTYRSSLEHTKNMWSNYSIRDFMKSSQDFEYFKALNRDYLLTRIKDKVSWYMDLKEEEAWIVASFILGTYCYELFETYPILYLYAFRESGKSKLKKIIRLMSFNGTEASNISESSFFRTIESSKPCLCIDEYEQLNTERKKTTDLLLNSGIEKGTEVKRTVKEKGTFINKSFDVYCPKVICNITGINSTTLSRCLQIKLFRTTNKEKGSRRPKESDLEWKEIRNQCYWFMMIYWRDIKETYELYDYEKLLNRGEDIWKPVMSILKFCKPEKEKEVLLYVDKLVEERETGQLASDLVYDLLLAMRENVSEENWFKCKKITEWLSFKLDTDKPPTSWKVGKMLSKMIFEHRNNPNSEYKLSPKLIDEMLEKLNYKTKVPKVTEITQVTLDKEDKQNEG